MLSAGATQTWVGVLNGTYPIPACIAALFLGRVAARYGNKPVYAACLLAGALGLAGLCLLHDQYALMLPMVGIGIAWAGILAMPTPSCRAQSSHAAWAYTWVSSISRSPSPRSSSD